MSLQPDFDRASYVSDNSDTFTYDQPLAPVASPADDPALLAKAIVFGLAGAAVGAVVYGGFIRLTHIQIGYLAIGVAWLIAKAMEMGSNGRGGRPYQIGAVLLTILSVAAGNALMIYWSLDEAVRLTLPVLLKLLMYGFAEPFMELSTSPAGALIGLFILFVGLRAAWRMTSGVPGAVRHPFSR